MKSFASKRLCNLLIIFQIDSYKSLGDILNDIENDNLSELGYWAGDEDVIEEFLKAIEESK